ncbi:MAG: glycosyltransferase family 2 protein [Anaerolineales bacterium]|nr:glycosyltransferase family 2 protein [Anaerolineales bacterium]
MKVSVIIPAYNQGVYLGKAVQSVLDQTYPDFDIIIVDDGSTDVTADIARGFKDQRIRYIYQENRGLSAARNTGIQNSDGELLTFLDSDDLFFPDKLEVLVAELNHHPEVGFVAGQAVLIDENGNPLGEVFNTPLPEDPARLLLWNPLHVCSVMVRRLWIDRVGLFDERFRAYEDWDMWLRLARAGCPMRWTPHPVSMYRFHTHQMTQDRERMTTATFAVLAKVFSDPTLPEHWKNLKDLAYANAYLRAAIQAYRVGDFQEGRQALGEAVRLDPDLCANDAKELARRLSALADSPKIHDKLSFLEQVYQHLPDSLLTLERRKRADLGQFAVDQGFAAYQRGNWALARRYLLQAIKYQPRYLMNRGVLAILLRSMRQRSTSASFPKTI